MESFGIKKYSFPSTYQEEDNKHQMLVLKTNSCRKNMGLKLFLFACCILIILLSHNQWEKVYVCVYMHTYVSIHIRLYMHSLSMIVPCYPPADRFQDPFEYQSLWILKSLI